MERLSDIYKDTVDLQYVIEKEFVTGIVNEQERY